MEELLSFFQHLDSNPALSHESDDAIIVSMRNNMAELHRLDLDLPRPTDNPDEFPRLPFGRLPPSDVHEVQDDDDEEDDDDVDCGYESVMSSNVAEDDREAVTSTDMKTSRDSASTFNSAEGHAKEVQGMNLAAVCDLEDEEEEEDVTLRSDSRLRRGYSIIVVPPDGGRANLKMIRGNQMKVKYGSWKKVEAANRNFPSSDNPASNSTPVARVVTRMEPMSVPSKTSSPSLKSSRTTGPHLVGIHNINSGSIRRPGLKGRNEVEPVIPGTIVSTRL